MDTPAKMYSTPFLRILPLYVAGIIAGSYLSPFPFFILVVAMAGAIILTLNFLQAGLGHVRPFIFMLLIWITGFTRIQLADQQGQADVEIEEYTTLTGIALDIERKRTTHVRLRTETLANDSSQLNNSITVITYLDPEISIGPGDLIRMKGTLRRTPGPTNPGQFNYARYLERQGIHYQFFLHSAGDLHILRKGAGWRSRIYDLRKRCLELLESVLHEKALSLTAALVLGTRELLTPETRENFIATGAVHVLAVSGLHVGILMQLCLYLFFFVRSKAARWYLTIAIIWMYALFVGAPPSVIRAAGMITLYGLARIMSNRPNPLNVLMGVGFLILFVDPNQIFDVGFQFSFLALLGIILMYRRFTGLYRGSNWLVRRVVQLTGLCLSAQVFLLPLSLHYFHLLPSYFVLSSLVAVPLVTIILPVGILLPFALLAFQTLGNLLAWLTNHLTDLLLFFITSIKDLPGATWEGIHVSVLDLFLYYSAVLAVIILIRKKPHLALKRIIFLVPVLIFVHTLQVLASEKHRTIYFYNLGPGTVIDVFEGRRVVHIPLAQVATHDYQFSILPNRIGHRMRRLDTLPVLLTSCSQLLEIHGTQILIVNIKIPDKKIPISAPDYILIRTDAIQSLADLPPALQSATILLDSSNSRWLNRRLLREGAEKHIEVIDLRQTYHQIPPDSHENSRVP